MTPSQQSSRSTLPPHVAALITFYETLREADVERMGDYYADDSRFKDPFNDLRGLAGVKRAFAHMFETLDEPRFVILESIVEGERCALTWDFTFRRKGLANAYKIHGLTWLRFNGEGKVIDHIDYWDAAGELFSKLPILGSLIRWVMARLRIPNP